MTLGVPFREAQRKMTMAPRRTGKAPCASDAQSYAWLLELVMAFLNQGLDLTTWLGSTLAGLLRSCSLGRRCGMQAIRDWSSFWA